MNVVDLLASLAKLDIRLWLEGENLRFSAPEGAFTGSIREQVVARKSEIIEFLRQARKLNEQPIPVIERDGPLPVSFSQQRLWVLDRLNPNDITYSMSSALRIRGPLKLPVLEKVFASLVQRHESLRTRFVEIDGEPFQVVDPFNGWTLAVEDGSALAESQHEQYIQQAVNQAALTPYDLSTGPLFRARLLKLNDQHHVLITGMHHIISDAWSMEIMVREIGTLYFAFAANLPSPLPPLSIQYADYSAWQRQQMQSDDMQKHRQYWVKTLAGAPPVLDIPVDRPRRDIPSSNGALLKIPVPADIARQINSTCGQQDLTPFMFFLSAWQMLLGRIANSKDVVIGAPVAGRNRGETQEIIGFFVNLLLLRLDLSGNPTVQTVLQRAKEMVLSAFTHQDMPIDHLMDVMAFERQPGYPPLAQSMFQLLNIDKDHQSALGNDDLVLEPLEQPHVTARMDLVLGVAKIDDRYQLSMEYNTDLFNESTVMDLLQCYLRVLQVFSTEPTREIDSIRLWDERELLMHLEVDPFTHQLLPLSSDQLHALAPLAGSAILSRQFAVMALDETISDDVLVKALQQIGESLPLLRARLIRCGLRGADPAYWLVAAQSAARIEAISCPGTDPLAVEKTLLTLRCSGDDALCFYRVNQADDRSALVVGALPGALDGDSLQQLLQAIVAVATSATVSELKLLPAGDSVAVVTSGNELAEQLQDVEALQFTRPATAPRSTRQCLPQLERVSLDFRQRDCIVEFAAARGLDLAGYFQLLFGLMLQHYCRPETAFAFMATVTQSHPGYLGVGHQKRLSVVPKSLLSGASTLQQWCEQFSKNTCALKIADAILVSMLPHCETTFRLHVLDGQSARFVEVVSTGDVILQVHSSDEGLELSLYYDADRFVSLQFLQRLLHISEQIVFGDVADIAQLTFLSSGELHQLHGYAAGNPDTTDATVVEQFVAQASRTPDNIAVIAGETAITYGELDQRSNRLAHWLQSQGVSANVRVGICLDRSIDLVVAIFAVLKAGGAYVPMDPAYPRERLAFMAKDSSVPLIITHRRWTDHLGACNAALILLDQNVDTLAMQPDTALQTQPSSDDQIYVIYTSGSTGQPKGAMVCHRGEANLQYWYLNELGIGTNDATLLISAVGFDLTQKNIFAPLMVGARLVLPAMELFDENEVLKLIEQHRITWINCAPSALYPLVETSAAEDYRSLQSLRYVVLGGEPIRMNALFNWLAHAHCHARVVNSYGPTECTDVVSWHCAERIDSPQQVLPIGRPINGTQLYVLNDYLNPVVPGLVGEICVGGIGVGLGYIDRPDITAAVFVDNPFGSGKLYRTGDLGRYLPNGEIEYIGRKDFQVKLRGLRIELGEIEFALKQLPGVEDSLVLVRDETLLGYVVATDAFTGTEWRVPLRDYLPEYMIPAVVIPLQRWPLTPNGKIDRNALPAAPSADDLKALYVAPRNDTEARIAQIWQELLDKPVIGVLDDLFALGGNSLTATRILSRINKQFGVQVSVRQFFLGPNVADLAVAVERAQQLQSIPPIKPVDHGIPQPLSFAQQRLWFLDQFEPGNLAYSMPAAFRVAGKLDVNAFSHAVKDIVQRHAILRSRIVLVDDQPCQIIDSADDWSLIFVDSSAVAPHARDEVIKKRVAEWRNTPFDLATGPLFRVELVQFSESDFLLLVNMHHIVSDGWSNGILLRELGLLYDAHLHQRPAPLPALPIQYIDFAQWQRAWLNGGELERQIAYWREQLAGVEVLNLPTDFPRRADTGFDGAVFDITLDRDLVAGLNRLSRQKGATLYMTLVAGFMVLLGRYSAQRDITVGSPIANRHHAEIESLIGCFINSLVIRGSVEPDLPFEQLLAQVCKNTLDGYAHQDVPFERLVEELVTDRNLHNSPLFQVMFALQNVPMETRSVIPGLKLDPIPEPHVVAKFDLSVSLLEVDDIIRGEVVYRTGLFTDSTVRRMMDQYIMLLRSIVANPAQQIGKLNLLPGEERKRILVDWNQTRLDYDCRDTIPRAFERQVASHPEHIALIVQGRALTYHELNGRANQLSRYLIEKGLQPGQYVGVFCERSADMVVSLLAILKAGAAYLPLDPEYPQARIRYVVEDAKPPFIVTQSALLERLQDVPAEQIALDTIACTLQALSSENISIALDATRPAYAIYTSGSTGNPKGVVIPQQAFINFLHGMQHSIGLHQQDRLLAVTSLSFDIAGLELFMPLLAGARVVLATKDEARDVEQLLRLLKQEKISFMQATPATWHMLVNEPWQPPTGFKVLCGGEPMPMALANKLLQRGVALYNVYGPTETTVWSTVYKVEGEVTGNIPIGVPIANTTVYVLDEYRQPVPVGVPGELYIGGHGVALGYMNRPDLTAERFIENPFRDGLSDRLYRTGDLVRFRHDGNLECLGRLDHQVKIRGFRIELGEIEAILNRHDGVKEGIVHYHDDAQGVKFLVGYVVAKGELGVTELRQYLAAKLPDYMVPTAFVFLNSMPLTPNGKVDRKALPAPHAQQGVGQREIVQPASETEKLILQIWCDVLGVESISVEDDFFSVGGHSLLATQVVARMRNTFGVKLPLRALFEAPTIRNAAQLIDDLLAKSSNNRFPPLVPINRSGPLPLSFVQQQLWLLDQLDPGTPAYNMPVALRLRGELNLAAFEQAFVQIIARHETLRSNFIAVDGDPQVVIHDNADWAFEYIDLSSQSVVEQQHQLQALAKAQASKGFDLANDRLIRGALVKLANDENGKPQHAFVGCMHHIISDGWSLNIMVNELMQFYHAQVHGSVVRLPELTLQYVDVAAWQRQWLQGDVLASHLAYWRERLDNDDQILDLPTDFPRPPVMTTNGASVRRELNLDLANRARALAAEEGGTLFMVLLAVFQLLMSRYTGQKRINIGTPIAGRDTMETEHLVGFFINTVVMSSEISEQISFRKLLRQVREVALSAYEHQALPFEKIIEELKPRRDTSRTPFFQVFLNLLNMPVQAEGDAELVVEPLTRQEDSVYAKYDLNLYVSETQSGLDLMMVYNRDLFRPHTIERMMDDFRRLFGAVLMSSDEYLWRISHASSEAMAQLPSLSQPLQARECVSPVERFLHQVQQHPDAIALLSAAGNISYAELESRSGRVRDWLRSQNIGTHDAVAIVAARHPDLIAAVLGVLRAGAVFTIIDASYPAERIATVLRELKPRALLTTAEIDGAIDAFLQPLMDELACRHVSRMVDLPADLPVQRDAYNNHQRAYIAFTSGTTGLPKGIAGSFGPVAHFVDWYLDNYQVTENDCFSLLSGLSHDPLLRDIFVPLAAGARIAIPTQAQVMDPKALLQWFATQGVTCSHLTPAMCRLLLTDSGVALPALRLVGMGGDRLTADVIHGLRGMAPSVQVVNFYGATETPQVMAAYTVPMSVEETGVMPLGRGIEGVQLLVVDEHLQVVAPGQAGQIVIRTPYLAEGYINQVESSAYRSNPLSNDPSDRLYLTGDKGRFRADGVVEYLGRLDQQVKIRGFRVEPAEIQFVMRELEWVSDAVVVPGVDPQGELCLIGYAVLLNQEEGWQDLLRAHLRTRLPDYMVPSLVIAIDQVPLTPNGKLNRSGLPDPAQHWVSKEYIAPRTEYEKAIAAIWQDVMKRDRIGINDHFFDIGGHSLLAVQIVARVKEQYAVEFSMRRLFEMATIAGMASYVENAVWLRESEASTAADAGDDYEEIEI